jgi:hypothetical protein
MIVSLVKTISNEQATHCKAGGKCLVLNLSAHPLKYVEVLGVETHKNTFSHIVLSSSNCRFLTSFCHLETTQRGSHCRWHKSSIILSGSGLHSLHHIQVCVLRSFDPIPLNSPLLVSRLPEEFL